MNTAKERIGGGFDDDAKFDAPWRRDGPLPDLKDSRDSSRRRFEGDRQPPPSTAPDDNRDWRSTSRPLPSSTSRTHSGDSDSRPPRRTGFGGGDSTSGADGGTWAIGSKFKPSEDVPPPSGGGSRFGGGGFGGRPPVPVEEGDWRRKPTSRGSTSPNRSTPPTPARRKLELIPRSTSTSTVVSPLSSPNPTNTSRPNPFGAAKFVTR